MRQKAAAPLSMNVVNMSVYCGDQKLIKALKTSHIQDISAIFPPLSLNISFSILAYVNINLSGSIFNLLKLL